MSGICVKRCRLRSDRHGRCSPNSHWQYLKIRLRAFSLPCNLPSLYLYSHSGCNLTTKICLEGRSLLGFSFCLLERRSERRCLFYMLTPLYCLCFTLAPAQSPPWPTLLICLSALRGWEREVGVLQIRFSHNIGHAMFLATRSRSA